VGECATRSVAGETILVPIRAGAGDMEHVFTLNESGKAIWQMLESPKRLEQIVDGLLQEFDVSEDDARKDASEFLADLQQAGLVAPEGSAQ
jgi:hypothetical protein